MRIAIFGGSFNPPGAHHVAIARALAREFDLVDVVPNGASYGKAGLASEAHRYAMCKIAFADLSGVEVSDLELGRPPGTVARDVDTVRKIREKHPDDRISSVRGADNLEKLLGFPTYPELNQLVSEFVIVPREQRERPIGLDLASGKLKGQKLGRYRALVEEGRIRELDVAAAGASSHAIRTCYQDKGNVEGLVPPEVDAYIREHRLYTRKPSKRPVPSHVREVLDPLQAAVVRRQKGLNTSYILDTDEEKGVFYCGRYDTTIGTSSRSSRFEEKPHFVVLDAGRWAALVGSGDRGNPRKERIKVSSRGNAPFHRLSPLTLHPEGIPVPGHGELRACSVENLWQGFKVFPQHGQGPFVELIQQRGSSCKLSDWVNHQCLEELQGETYGFQVGDRITSNKAEAVWLTYLPAYLYVIETYCADLLDQLQEKAFDHVVWLFDSDRCEDISQPVAFSHASILVHYLRGDWFGFFGRFGFDPGPSPEDWVKSLAPPYPSLLPSLLQAGEKRRERFSVS